MRSPSMTPKSESQKLRELFAKPNAFLIQAYPLQSMLRLPMNLRLELMRRQVSYKELQPQPRPQPRPASVRALGMVVSPERTVAERRRAERIQRELNELEPLTLGLNAVEESLQEVVAEEIRDALDLPDAVSADEVAVDLPAEVDYQFRRF